MLHETYLVNYETKYLSKLKMGKGSSYIPHYRNPKLIRLGHYVMEYSGADFVPLYDMIISRETLKKLKAVLDFNIEL